ncbi:hypothetical protein [Arthrobacter sp. NPDC089319]|uniref:hypothetical protein n=1 Tax=Arthrobacter sp. NPDC089319 TaxID=3155915 RepID=UPI00341C4E2C
MEKTSQLTAMKPVKVEDWAVLKGVTVDVRLNGRVICSGVVDAVTADGSILWVQPAGSERRLFEKRRSYEAWTDEQSAPFIYRISGKSKY